MVPQHLVTIVEPLKNTTIDAIAASFIDLQQARHTADYDHLVAYSKATALAHVRDARESIKRLEGAGARRREMFFALLPLSARAN
jgi:isopropylmalate/homocitrate/citramalate synthase